mgnify:CR=1 FL=1
MLKRLYNKNITRYIFNNLKKSYSALATKQPLYNETIDKFYEIELLHKNIQLLQPLPAEDTICPLCHGHGYIPCPSCRNGCRECNNMGEIDCPLCNRIKY